MYSCNYTYLTRRRAAGSHMSLAFQLLLYALFLEGRVENTGDMQLASWTSLVRVRLPIPGQAIEVLTQEFGNGALSFLSNLSYAHPKLEASTLLSDLGSSHRFLVSAVP